MTLKFNKALNEAFEMIAESLPQLSFSSMLNEIKEDVNLIEATHIQFIAKNVFVVNTYLDGKLNSVSGYPATSTFVIRSCKGKDSVKLIEKTFYKDGFIHNEDGPAQVFVYENGHTIQSWYKNGQLHREGEPAVIAEKNAKSSHGFSYKNEDYYLNGISHREDGPARVMWANGAIVGEIYYLFGYEFKSKKAYNTALKRYLKTKASK